MGAGWYQAVPHRWKANFLGCVCFDFPKRVFREGAGAWATLLGSHSAGGSWGVPGSCPLSIPQKPYLPPSSQVDRPVDTFPLCFPRKGCFRISAACTGLGKSLSLLRKQLRRPAPSFPTFLNQQRCSLPSVPEGVREDVCKRFGNP